MAATLRDMGNAGVDLFFVLSGYLIYGTLIRKPYVLSRYLYRRAERIYPAFLAVFAVYLLLSWLVPERGRIPWDQSGVAALYILENLLLLPGLFPIEPIITVAWSLSYEVFYYLVVPVLIAVLGLRQWSSGHRIALFVAMALLGGFAGALLGASQIRLVMFAAGIILFECLESRALPGIDVAGLVALVLGLLAIELFAYGPWRYAVLFVSFFALCLAAFATRGLTYRAFCWTPLRWLGNMSYSYYLIHGLALKAGFELLDRLASAEAGWTLGFWGLMPVMFLVSLIPGTALFALVEKPLSLGGIRLSVRPA
jgi:peptidoglycan/LPS O-acetylase OafA/YrhL